MLFLTLNLLEIECLCFLQIQGLTPKVTWREGLYENN